MSGRVRRARLPGGWAQPRLLAVAGLLAFAGCDRTPGSGPPGVVVDTLASGVIRVMNPAEGLWPDAEPRALTEELRIGASTGEGPEIFGNIAGIAVDREGRIHVLDAQAAELRVFAVDGTHLRTLGGRGGGPGEFQNPVGLTLAPDGSIWVVDPGNGRYTVFDADGTLRATHPRPIGFFQWPWPTGFDRSGQLYDVGPGLVLRMSEDPGRAEGMIASDTLALPTFESERITVRSADGNMMMTMLPPFQPRQEWRFDPRGSVWVGVSDRTRIVQLDLAGDTVRIVERQHAPVPVTAAEADSAREQIRDQIARSTGPGAEIEGDLGAPRQKPAYRTFLVDPGGRLWVEPHLPAGSARILHVFDAVGVLMGAVEIPAGFRTLEVLPVIRDDVIHAVVVDEWDVPYVVRYRWDAADATVLADPAPGT